MRHKCFITARLAGPCASCRQPAWPAHVWPDGRILCATCCGCGRGGAQAAGTDAAPATIPPPGVAGVGAAAAASLRVAMLPPCRPALAGAKIPPRRAWPCCRRPGAMLPPRGCPTIRLTLTAPGRPARRYRGLRASARGRHGLALPPAACRPSNPARPEGCRRNALQALISRRRRLRRPEIPPRPFRTILGPFPALLGPSCKPARPALLPASRYRPACRTQTGAADAAAPGPPAGATTWPARTRCHAARPGRPAGVALAGPARDLHRQVCAALRNQNISLPECSGYNLIKNWRVT
jgi:hypothetical protein